MLRVLLISDTHGDLDPALLKHINACDEVWHAGDIGSLDLARTIQAKATLRAVFGNIDDQHVRNTFEEDLHFNSDGLRVYMTHIGGSPGKYPARVRSAIKEAKPHIFICGHSHILQVKHVAELNILHMNPGACGRQGFHRVKTALRFKINGGKISELAVIELGNR